MSLIKGLCCVLPGLIATGLPALAQQDAGEPVQSAERPAIGLVLSGGAARGGAHIGAIKALEELRVPVDYISGTSIGAAIGGLYASGMTVAELEAFVQEIDWEAAFLNTTPRELRSFRRKRDDDLFLVSQRPGLNDGEFELPTGVVQGQVIDLILSRATLPVARLASFDDLAIPFRAVAGDIATGEAVVLSGGDLGRAIRASMAVPAVLTPMEIDGRLLVDGGIVMNLPVEVAQTMGAEAIVAIDVTDTLSTREELRSVLDITQQLTNLLTRFGSAEQLARLESGDVLVRPEFGEEFTAVSFERMSETVQAGYDAVMAQRDALEAFALEPAEYQAYRAELGDPRDFEPPRIDFLRLDNQSPLADSIIEHRLGEIELGEPLDVDAVERALSRVYGLELYQNVRYAVVEDDGRTGLEVDLRERSWGPNYLQLGLEFSSASDEDALVGLAASYLRTAINEQGGELRATLKLGDEPEFQASLHQPLGARGMFFVSPSVDFQSKSLHTFIEDDLASEVLLREGILEVAAGRELADWGEIRAGLRGGFGEASLRVGDPTIFPLEDFRRGEFFARLSFDTLDNVSFPRSGALATAEWRGSRAAALAADADYDQLLLKATWAKTWGQYTLATTVRYDRTFRGTAPVNAAHRFGGFFDLSGLNRNQLWGQHAARLGANWYRRIGDFALFPAFAGVSMEVGNVWNEEFGSGFDTAMFGTSIWAGVDTPVGPIYAAYGRTDSGQDAFYVFLGRVF